MAPPLPTQNPVHTYPLSGIYNASLTAMTDAGCMATYSATVNVNPYPQAGLSAPPVCHQTPTQFINTTLFPPTIGSWSWDFGDGSPLNTTDWNPQHTYATPGNFTAQLITYSQNGVCTDTATTTTSVAPLPTPDFDFEDVCFGNTVEFTNTSHRQHHQHPLELRRQQPSEFFHQHHARLYRSRSV
jgi:PKD repeat protein